MLMKLALRNVRRSVRDYAVYFVTLTLGVAVFYAFNAIGDSRVLFEAQEGAANEMCIRDRASPAEKRASVSLPFRWAAMRAFAAWLLLATALT